MNDKLHQINVTYSNKQDRLLLRITTTAGDEFRIWLTRRFTTLLFSILGKEMDKYGGAVSLGTRQDTKKMFKAGAFEKRFEPDKTVNFPLGDEGYLAYGIKTGNSAEGNLNIEILPEKGQGVTFNLHPPLLYMMHNLLTQGVIEASWDQQIPGFQERESKQVH